MDDTLPVDQEGYDLQQQELETYYGDTVRVAEESTYPTE